MEEIVIKDEKLNKGYKAIILSFDIEEDYPFTLQCGLSSQIDMTTSEARQTSNVYMKLNQNGTLQSTNNQSFH